MALLPATPVMATESPNPRLQQALAAVSAMPKLQAQGKGDEQKDFGHDAGDQLSIDLYAAYRTAGTHRATHHRPGLHEA
jgi:hypothetical protein